MTKRRFHPESLMMTYGYKPSLSEGALKCPIFQTSTFVFDSAEEGKAFFELAYGLRDKKPNEQLGLIYSRVNNPVIQILEERLCLWDEAEESAVFESGMSAITTTFLEFLKPGDLFLYSWPVYGGTDHFINEYLPSIGVETLGFGHLSTRDEIEAMLKESGKADRLAMIFIETPANPTNDIIDISMCAEIARRYSGPKRRVLLAVDNTYMGPVWQHPLKHGADLVLYSATKYIGGHSDVIAGAALGSHALIARIKGLRTLLGSTASPHTAWLLLRSLETLKIRFTRQVENARKVARYLRDHELVERVHYPEFLPAGSKEREIFERQCESPGAMISFEITGGEREAFLFLNHLKLMKLAVSLGGTECLAQHPRTMTHAGLPVGHLDEMGVGPNLVRLSIGIENYEDQIWDLDQALEKVRMILQASEEIAVLEEGAVAEAG